MRHSDDVTREEMKKTRELSLLRPSAGCSQLIWDSSQSDRRLEVANRCKIFSKSDSPKNSGDMEDMQLEPG